MRSAIVPLILATVLLAAPAAYAGPTCQDQNGDSIRCGAPGAMPVGWTLPAAERANRPTPIPMAPAMMLGLFGFIGGFFVLIALMPDFQGRRGGWDDQQSDSEEEPV
jgi:hypothetical protein